MSNDVAAARGPRRRRPATSRIVNHYYLARELAEKPDLNVELYWASQDGDGAQ